MPSLRLGTRGSPLALWQAHHVTGLLKNAHPGLEIELVEIQTVGDQVRNVPLAQIGGEGVFTKAIQDALLAQQVDVAVHSLKDLPTIPVENLMLAAVPERGPTGDAFLSKTFSRFSDLPAGAVVATSSLRRRAQILHRRPDLHLVDLRGNVETRIKKLVESDLAAIVLAEAGLLRLGLESHITHILDSSWMLPAVGQGALGLECRVNDERTRTLLAPIDHPPTHARVLAERALLSGLGGGCLVPIGTLTRVEGNSLWLRGAVLAPEGRDRLESDATGTTTDPVGLGKKLARILLDQGAGRLLQTITDQK